MRHCPNAECPHRIRTERAAEFEDHVETCSDCSTPLVEGEAPADVSPPSPAPTPALWRRLVITLFVPVVLLVAHRIQLPGLDVQGLDVSAKGMGILLNQRDPANTSIFALGVMPFVSACLLVELVALVVPRWRALRHGGPVGRAKLWRASLILGVALALFQGWSITVWIDALGIMVSPGLVSQAIATLTMVGGTVCLVFLAQLVDRFGLASGFGLLVAAQSSLQGIRRLVGQLIALEVVVPIQYAALAAAIAGASLLTWWTRRRAEAPPAASVWIPEPASGTVPLQLAASLLLLPVTVGNVGLDLGGLARVLNDASTHLVIEVVIVTLATLGLSFLFNRPARIAELWSRAGRSPPAEIDAAVRGSLGRTIRQTLLFVLGLVALRELSTRIGLIYVDAALVSLVTALALDVVAEWRARRQTPDLVPIWPEHRPYAIGAVRQALADAGITMVARGEHQRSLLQFAGPYVPIELMVAPADVKRATKIVAKVLAPGFADRREVFGDLPGKRPKKARPAAAVAGATSPPAD